MELITGNAFINGKWISGPGNFDVVNPATNEIIKTVTDLSVDAVRDAITAADDVLTSWRTTTAGERSTLLLRWFSLINEHKQELAEIITRESGKPLAESLGEVAYGASFVEWFAEEARRAYGDTIPAPGISKRIVTVKQGIGVVAAITSWNFPLAMITRKVAPAIAAGCSVVLRPASKTPLTALALAVLAEKAGWPNGIFNVVTGTDSSAAGKELSTNPLVRKLSFTGSTFVGKILMQQAASNIKKVSLELGGNAPFIVFEDADVDAAVKGALYAKHRNAGQTCVAVNRFFIHDAVFEEFAEKLTLSVKALKVGNGLLDGIEIGPLVNKKGLQKVEDHIADAVSKGARILTGGKLITGLFYEPTVLDNVPMDTLVANEETFGPVSFLFRFNSEEEAVRRANDTEFGLAAYLYSNNVSRCWRVSEALEVGMVGINEGQISAAVAPFGGIKSSGIGREGSWYGLEEFMEIKYLCFGLLK